MFDVSAPEKVRDIRWESKPTFVIRADIVSTNGYARAARALARVIGERNEVLGVSIHEDPNDRSEVFPGELVPQEALMGLARERPLCIIHHTTPDQFVFVPSAINIGAFYWETRAIPRRFDWPEMLAMMDAVWAPTEFVADFTRDCGFEGPIHIVPWPQDFSRRERSSARSRALDAATAYYIDAMPARDGDLSAWVETRVGDVLGRSERKFLAVQSMAPRKGLPVLMSGWMNFLEATLDQGSILILKLGFRHSHGLDADPRRQIWSMLARFGARPGQRLKIVLIEQRLSDEDMAALTLASDCLVSATYGEGFGGPIVEALIADRPVIAPRHTGITDLLPPGYEFAVEDDELRVTLRGNLEIYSPSSTWRVPRPVSLASAFERFRGMSESQRSNVVARARAYAEGFCGLPAAGEKVDAAIAGLASIGRGATR